MRFCVSPTPPGIDVLVVCDTKGKNYVFCITFFSLEFFKRILALDISSDKKGVNPKVVNFLGSMTYLSATADSSVTSYYHRRIDYATKVFGITLRLAGVVLLVVQLVQAGMKMADGGGWLSTNIVVGCLFAGLLIWVSRRSTIKNAVSKFALSTHRPSTKRYIYTIPFLLVVFILWAKIRIGPVSDEWRYVSSEGSISEYGTALAYLLVPVFGYPMVKLFRRQNRRLMSSLYFLFIAASFFVGMEEISWGQRLLGFEPPEFIARHNVQSELTLHNLSFYQNHLLKPVFILVGFIGASCWIALRYWQARQRLAAQQLAKTASEPASGRSTKLDLSYFFPDWPISSFFYPILIFGILADYTAYGRWYEFHAAADHEHWEFIMGLGVLLFVVVNFFRQARLHDSSKNNLTEQAAKAESC